MWIAVWNTIFSKHDMPHAAFIQPSKRVWCVIYCLFFILLESILSKYQSNQPTCLANKMPTTSLSQEKVHMESERSKTKIGQPQKQHVNWFSISFSSILSVFDSFNFSTREIENTLGLFSSLFFPSKDH